MTAVVTYADAAWKVPSDAPLTEGAPLRRALLMEGYGGFYSHVIDLPPGYRLPSHSHDRAELLIVLGGSAQVAGQTLRAFDTVAIDADELYGLTAGADGLQFMIVRNDKAATKVRK